jgi:hypothetical protein
MAVEGCGVGAGAPGGLLLLPLLPLLSKVCIGGGSLCTVGPVPADAAVDVLGLTRETSGPRILGVGWACVK